MIKPNDAAREQMRKAARDMQALIEHNDRIAMEWRTMVVALEAGDLAGAQLARRRANALSPEGVARCEVAEMSWGGVAVLDPVAWADVHRDSEPKPKVETTLTPLTAENAPEIAKKMPIEMAKKVLELHRMTCSHPACPISRALVDRIRELGGAP